MLVFNCTKAAEKIFNKTSKGKKISFIELAPEDSIPESAEADYSVNNRKKTDCLNWQWLVNGASIKRKKYLIAVDCVSRHCLIFPATAKGDHFAFVDMFNKFLVSSFSYWAKKNGKTPEEIENYMQEYEKKIEEYIFYQRTDEDTEIFSEFVLDKLEEAFSEDGVFVAGEEFLSFGLNVAEAVKKKVDSKRGYLLSHEVFIRFWQEKFSVRDEFIA